MALKMDELRGRMGLVGAVVLLLVALVALWAMMRPPANTPDAPDGLAYQCQACKKPFTMTVKAVSDHQRDHYGEPIKCPSCGNENTARVNQCPKCKEVFPINRQGEQPPCPKCGTKLRTPS